jgi:hypothetical protein
VRLLGDQRVDGQGVEGTSILDCQGDVVAVDPEAGGKELAGGVEGVEAAVVERRGGALEADRGARRVEGRAVSAPT